MNVPRWLTGLVLVGLLIALYMNWAWPWGLLFIYWSALALLSGEAFLLGPIKRNQDVILFWIVTVLWTLLGAMMLLADAAPSFINNLYAFLGSSQ